MSNDNDPFANQAAAFQKAWAESASKMAQAAFAFTPESAPEETLKQIRGGIFKALAHSWEEFLRSPEFLKGMKEWMDQAINFRQMSQEFMAKARQEFQEPSRSDLDGVLVAVRSLENRILQRVEELSSQVEALQERLGDGEEGKQPAPASTKPGGRTSPGMKTKSKGRGR